MRKQQAGPKHPKQHPALVQRADQTYWPRSRPGSGFQASHLFIIHPQPESATAHHVQVQQLITLTVSMLTKALNIMLGALGLDSAMFSLHNLYHGGATAAYGQCLDQVDIKRHGLCASDCFLTYITLPCMSISPVTVRLASPVQASAGFSPQKKDYSSPHPHASRDSSCHFTFITVDLICIVSPSCQFMLPVISLSHVTLAVCSHGD